MTEKSKANKKVPNLRFPGFEGEWEVKRLGEIGEIIGGGTPETNKGEYWDGSIQWFTPTEIKSNFVSKSGRTISELGLKNSSAKILPPGTILLTTRATIGEAAIALEECTTNQGFQSLLVNKNWNNVFVFNWFKNNKHKLIKLANGSTFPEISKSELSKIELIIPQFKEQGKIASFLTLIDERIATQNKIIEELRSVKLSLIRKIFIQQLRFKNNLGNYYPEWQTKKFGDITKIVNKRNKDNRKLPVYSINNKLGFVPQNEQFEGVDSDERGYDIKLYKLIEKNTFAYNPARINVGSIGYSGNLENIIISSLYVCFKTTEEINDEFLFQYLRTDLFNREVLKSVEGGVRDYLFYDNFASIKLKLPIIEEQIQIAKFLSALDRKIDTELNLLQQLEMQKRYLLQNLFI